MQNIAPLPVNHVNVNGPVKAQVNHVAAIDPTFAPLPAQTTLQRMSSPYRL